MNLTFINSIGRSSFQLLTLANSTIVLVIILSYNIWLYNSSKNDVEFFVEQDLAQKESLTLELINQKRSEIDKIANIIIDTAVIKSAIRTNHLPTIIDTVKSIKAQYSVAFAAILKGKQIIASSHDVEIIQELTRGRIIGLTKYIDEGVQYSFVIGLDITNDDLYGWKKITRADYILKSNGLVMSTIPTKSVVIENIKTKFYDKKLSLFNDSIEISILTEKATFWKPFNRKRNTLVILGGVFFILGIILSFLISYLFFFVMNNEDNTISKTDFQEMIRKIQLVKNFDKN